MSGTRRFRHPALALFAAAAIPRLVAWRLFPLPEPNYNYWLARGLIDLRAFALGDEPTSFIEPLYPAFLAVCMTLAGGDRAVLLVQALVAASGAPAMYLIGRRVSGSRQAGIAAALLYAADPYFVRQASSFIELPFLLPLFLWALERSLAVRGPGSGVVAGALLGAVLLTRSALLPAVAGVLFVMVRRQRRPACAAAAALAAMVLPWALRSHAVNGSGVPTRAGENLYVSTSPYAVGVLPRYDADLLVRFAQFRVDERLQSSGTGRDEALADHLLLDEAVRYAVAQPAQTAALKLANLGWAFAPVLLPRNAKHPLTHAAVIDGRMALSGLVARPFAWDLAFTVFRTTVLAAALFALRHRRRLDDGWVLAVIAGELAVNVVFFPTTRLMAQSSAMLMLYAGWALAQGTQAFRARMIQTSARASNGPPS